MITSLIIFYVFFIYVKKLHDDNIVLVITSSYTVARRVTLHLKNKLF